MSAFRELRRARTDAYFRVWCDLFALEPGETTTLPELARLLRARELVLDKRAVYRAEDGLLLTREELRSPSGAVRWSRSPLWPSSAAVDADPIRLEPLLFAGASRSAVLAILDALVRGGYLELTPRGYEVKPL